MQPREIAEAVKNKLSIVANKKSFFTTFSNNLKSEFAVDYIKFSTLTYDEWVQLKNKLDEIIGGKIAVLQEEKLKQLEQEQEAIQNKIKSLKHEMSK